MFDVHDEPMAACRAHTVRAPIRFAGIGLHSGRNVNMTVSPAPAGAGIVFRRLDLLGAPGPVAKAEGLARVSVPATPEAVTATTLGTVIANRHGVSVATIEHLMAALSGCGVDSALVDLDGPELPILDGSSAPFVAAILETGTRALAAARHSYRIVRPVTVEKDGAMLRAEPVLHGRGLDIDVEVDYADPAIGRHHLQLDDALGRFSADLAAARTFCRLSDVEAMRARGLGLGGSLANAIVVSDGAILNPEGLRVADEFVRHKALDLIGDLYLVGAPLIGRITATRPGHDINVRLARALFAEGALAAELPDAPPRVAMRAHAAAL